METVVLRLPKLGPVALLLAVLLSACSDYKTPPPVAEGAEHIACAIGGARDFKPVCALDRGENNGMGTLIVRHPDGAFRRFAVGKDALDIVVADGADPASVTQEGDRLSVKVGPDRYLLPVTQTKDADAP